MTASGQAGEFKNNTIVRGSANPGTDIGLRNVEKFTISGNVFHDNGATYSIGKVGSGVTATPVFRLGLKETGVALQYITHRSSAGSNGIWIYGNPIRSAELQLLAAENRWQVFDITGRESYNRNKGFILLVAGRNRGPIKLQVVE